MIPSEFLIPSRFPIPSEFLIPSGFLIPSRYLIPSGFLIRPNFYSIRIHILSGSTTLLKAIEKSVHMCKWGSGKVGFGIWGRDFRKIGFGINGILGKCVFEKNMHARDESHSANM